MATRNLNVPNVLSGLRILLAAALFALIGTGFYVPALGVFLAAAVTDFVDGWWARHFHQCTQLGRMLDTFADKILICGAFIMFAALPLMQRDWMLIQPWMAVLIAAREMLVSYLKVFMESSGVSYGAKWSGKIKMFFQCITVALACVWLAMKNANSSGIWMQVAYWSLVTSLWVTILSTLQSGLEYIVEVGRILCKTEESR